MVAAWRNCRPGSGSSQRNAFLIRDHQCYPNYKRHQMRPPSVCPSAVVAVSVGERVGEGRGEEVKRGEAARPRERGRCRGRQRCWRPKKAVLDRTPRQISWKPTRRPSACRPHHQIPRRIRIRQLVATSSDTVRCVCLPAVDAPRPPPRPTARAAATLPPVCRDRHPPTPIH